MYSDYPDKMHVHVTFPTIECLCRGNVPYGTSCATFALSA